MDQTSFTDLDSAHAAMVDLVRAVADARAWDPVDLADAEADLGEAYSEANGWLWDDLPLYWQRVTSYASEWTMDGADKLVAVTVSGSQAAADEADEEYLGSYSGAVIETVSESATDVADAATTTGEVVKSASESSYTGPVLVLLLALGVIVLVRR